MDQLSVDPTSATPPYEQLRTQLAGLVASGGLAPGTRLPTVRRLATDLGLAANTVARVYKELEADGVVVTEGRRGTFVRSGVVDGGGPGTAAGDGSAAQAGAAAREYALAARRLGLTLPEATRLLDRAWHRHDEGPATSR